MNRTQIEQAGGPAPEGTPGRCVTIRRASGDDLAALGEFFAGLSTRTRWLRFFAPLAPTGAMLRRLSGAGDRGGPGNHAGPGDHGTASGSGVDALVARWGTVIIGHAMAVDRPGPGGTRQAEVGVVVADAWQGRGVGSALMRTLIAGAGSRGVTCLTMDVLPGNARVLAMIAGHWPTAQTRRGADCVTVGVRLPAAAGYPSRPPDRRPRRERSTCHACGATATASSRMVANSA